MGVSKAVLENVIFVHQEESNWPLAEGQVCGWLCKWFEAAFIHWQSWVHARQGQNQLAACRGAGVRPAFQLVGWLVVRARETLEVGAGQHLEHSEQATGGVISAQRCRG